VIDGFDDVLDSDDRYCLPELRTVLQELFSGSGSTARVIGQQRLKRSVYRVQLEANGGVRSVVLKRLAPGLAQRNQLVATRWLPALGLGDSGPALLAVAAERSGRCVWHIYENLGDRTLAAGDADPRQIEAAVALIAQLHTRSAGHALLPECRVYGGDLVQDQEGCLAVAHRDCRLLAGTHGPAGMPAVPGHAPTCKATSLKQH
jgi:hypothetical protein